MLKQLVSINQNNLVEKDICEHILSILAAILSDINLHKEFEHLLSTIQLLLTNISDDNQWINEVSF